MGGGEEGRRGGQTHRGRGSVLYRADGHADPGRGGELQRLDNLFLDLALAPRAMTPRLRLWLTGTESIYGRAPGGSSSKIIPELARAAR